MLTLAYIIGNFGIFYINATINTFFLVMFEEMGVYNPAVFMGVGWIVGAALEPFIGIISDRYIKIGRKLFILVGTILCLIALSLLYQEKGHIILNILMFYYGFHIYQIPLGALIPDQINKGRLQKISGLWNLSGALGSIAAPLFGVFLLRYGYNYIYIGLLIVIMFTTTIPLLLVKESKHIDYRYSIRKVITDYVSNKVIRDFYTAKFLWWMGLGCYLPFIVNNLIERGLTESVSGIVFTSFMIVNCVSLIFLSRFKIKDFNAVLSYAIISFGLCTMIMYLNISINIMILLVLITGMMYGIIMLCSYEIMVEMIPQGEGGMYLGIDNVFLNIPQALSAFLVSTTFDVNSKLFLAFTSFFMSLSYIYIMRGWNN